MCVSTYNVHHGIDTVYVCVLFACVHGDVYVHHGYVYAHACMTMHIGLLYVPIWATREGLLSTYVDNKLPAGTACRLGVSEVGKKNFRALTCGFPGYS